MLLKLLKGHNIGYIEPSGSRMVNGCRYCIYNHNDNTRIGMGHVGDVECSARNGKTSFCIDNTPQRDRLGVTEIVSVYGRIVNVQTT